jgi:hypothetical protein
MPRLTLRSVLLLSTLLLLYHWAFGLPNLTGGTQRFFGTTPASKAPVDEGYDFSRPYKKRIVAIGGTALIALPSSAAY